MAALRLATRGSALARAQAGWVADQLGGADLVEAAVDGERGDKSRFTRGVESALLDDRADIGVHSAKDLPTATADGLVLAAVPSREEAADAWVGEAGSLEEVAEGATVGTASLRRRSQLLALRPDLRVVELRGNVDTRLAKLDAGEVDALVLAAAGLRRLGRADRIAFLIDPAQMTPAPGQGALALQARAADEAASRAAEGLTDPRALTELTAERALVARLAADCSTPLGAKASLEGDRLTIDSYVGLPDGSEWIRDRFAANDPGDPLRGGSDAAGRLLASGADELLARAAAMAEADR